jgi:putative ABC transport system permease protein
MEPSNDLISIPGTSLLLSVLPLFLIALFSKYMNLDLESPIIVGCFRSFFQLCLLGFILKPIFDLGDDHWWVVCAYVTFMIVITTFESMSRSKYAYRGMFRCIFLSIAINVVVISFFTFGLIIKPQGIMLDPQYVIPINGMILGNCINGISLSLNSLLTSLIENQVEIDLFLSFGANASEASNRIFRESIRVGLMPMLNAMAVIGVVSIPGMMTGQILGGTPVMEAAKYQLLIIYLISISTFGSVIAVVSGSLNFVFDFSRDTFCTDRLIVRRDKNSLAVAFSRSIRALIFPTFIEKGNKKSELLPFKKDIEAMTYKTCRNQFKFTRISTSLDAPSKMQICGVSLEITRNSDENSQALFEDISFNLGQGDLLLLEGPSGCGKSQLLRLIAGINQLTTGTITFEGKCWNLNLKQMSFWRQQIRYVTQVKVSIPGTPQDFLSSILAFHSRQAISEKLSFDEMMVDCCGFLVSWGMDKKHMNQNWNNLSGGESQRVILAIAIVSRPKVLLLDECTSSLDPKTKLIVEKSIMDVVKKESITVIWVTHDEDQVKRLIEVFPNYHDGTSL